MALRTVPQINPTVMRGGSAFQVPVLMYHALDDTVGDYLVVPPALFRQQMLAVTRVAAPWSLSALQAELVQGKAPSPVFALTFDDGYVDALQACSILDELHISATWFLTPQLMGGDNGWNRRAHSWRRHFTVDEGRQLVNLGQEIGAHGWTHHRLTKLSDADLRFELSESQVFLCEQYGVPIRFVAYPYGGVDIRVAAVASEFYNLGFATGRGVADWRTDSFSIRRLYVGPETHPDELARLVLSYCRDECSAHQDGTTPHTG